MGCTQSQSQNTVKDKSLTLNPSTSSGAKQIKFSEKYRSGIKLGEGAFAVVKECQLKSDNGAMFAAKIVDRERLSKADDESLKTEVRLLQSCCHPNIVNCVDFLEEPNKYYIVMELCRGGELFDRIVAKTSYNEAEARGVVRQLLAALQYIHSNNIVHRDLKPENLLLAVKDSDDCIKLADFGFATKVANNNLTALCGTPGYVAPEILARKHYGLAVDMWSIGVIIYIILGGYPPFSDANQKKLFDKIKRGSFEFHAEYWDHVSDEAKSLIKRLLVVDPNKRLTASAALEDPWLCDSDDRLSVRSLDMNLRTFKKFNARRKFKAGIKAVIAANKFEQIMASFKASGKYNTPSKDQNSIPDAVQTASDNRI